MTEVASAWVGILPSARGFGKKLNSQISGDLDKSGKSGGERFGKALKIGAAAALGGAAVAGLFFKNAIDEASDLSESASKVGVVFGDQARQIMKASKTSATAMGLSKAAYLGATGSLGNLLVSLDIAPKKAAGLSQEMVKLAGDLASFNNTSPEEALAALQSGLTGETEPLKRFGVNMNDATLRAQALKLGLIDTVKDALNPQAKALAAQALIMDQTKTAQGDFARTSGGLANQQRILAAQFDNVKATVGTALLPVITQFVGFLTASVIPGIAGFVAQMKSGEGAGGRIAAVISNVTADVTLFAQQMRNGTGAGGQFAAVLSRAASVILKLTGFMSRNKAAVGTFVAIIGTAIAVVKVWRTAQIALNFVLAANPIGIVVVAIAALAAGIVIAYKRSETFRNVVNGAFTAAKTGATSLANFVTKTIPAAFNTVVTFVRSIPARIAAIFTGAASVFYNAGVQLMAQLAAGITAKIGDAVNAAKAGLDRLKGLLPGSPIKWGPLKNWNNGGAGQRLMDLVTLGITKATPKTVKAAKSAFEKIGDALRAERDNLRSTLDGLKDDFASLASSVSSAFLGDLFNPPDGTSFIDNLLSKKSQLTGLLASFGTLKGWGLDPAFLSQLFASGNGALITELAGMGQSGATGAASLFGEVQSLGAQLGSAVASNDPVASRIDGTNKRLDRVNEQLAFLGSDIGKELNSVAASVAKKRKKRPRTPQ